MATDQLLLSVEIDGLVASVDCDLAGETPGWQQLQWLRHEDSLPSRRMPSKWHGRREAVSEGLVAPASPPSRPC